MLLISAYSNQLAWYLVVFTSLCLAPRVGHRLFIVYFVSDGLGQLAKIACHLPRPSWISDAVHEIGPPAGGFGMPSGHVLIFAVVSGYLAWQAKALRWRSVATALSLLVAASRVYLGAHFLSDAIGALALAAGIVASFRWLCSHSCIEKRTKLSSELPAVCVALMVLMGATLLVEWTTGGGSNAQAWSRHASARVSWPDLSQCFAGLIAAAVAIEIYGRHLGSLDHPSALSGIVQFVYGISGLYVVEQLLLPVANWGGWISVVWGICKTCLSVVWIVYIVPSIFAALNRRYSNPSISLS